MKPEFSTMRRRMPSIYYMASFSIMDLLGILLQERKARKVKFSLQHKNLTKELG